MRIVGLSERLIGEDPERDQAPCQTEDHSKIDDAAPGLGAEEGYDEDEHDNAECQVVCDGACLAIGMEKAHAENGRQQRAQQSRVVAEVFDAGCCPG